MKKPLNNNDEINIANLYSNKNANIRKIMGIYQIGEARVYEILNKFNVDIRRKYYASRKYNVNERYFEVIDSADKAYWLGWLFADGCNSLSLFHLTIQKNDIEILNKFKTNIDSEHPILVRDNKACLLISSKQMCNDLHSLGCVNAKSLILDWPKNLPDRLVKFFIRGYFEGDGCLSIFSRKSGQHIGQTNFYLGIMSSRIFIPELQNKIHEKTGLLFATRNIKNNAIIYNHSQSKISAFCDWMYNEEPNLYLTRKFNKYLEIKNFTK